MANRSFWRFLQSYERGLTIIVGEFTTDSAGAVDSTKTKGKGVSKVEQSAADSGVYKITLKDKFPKGFPFVVCSVLKTAAARVFPQLKVVPTEGKNTADNVVEIRFIDEAAGTPGEAEILSTTVQFLIIADNSSV